MSAPNMKSVERPTTIKFTSTIPDHWDMGGEITASSCPEMEFHLWRVHAKGDAEWSGEEFTLQTFEDYIDKLKEEDN